MRVSEAAYRKWKMQGSRRCAECNEPIYYEALSGRAPLVHVTPAFPPHVAVE